MLNKIVILAKSYDNLEKGCKFKIVDISEKHYKLELLNKKYGDYKIGNIFSLDKKWIPSNYYKVMHSTIKKL